MRIGMVLDSDFPPDSRVENEAVSLIDAGHEVFLFSLSYRGFKDTEEEINGIRVRRYKANKLIYKMSALAFPIPFYHFLVQPKIAHFIKENSIEALHVHDMLIAPAVLAANKKSKLLLTLDLHENRPEIMKHYPHLKRFPGSVLIKPFKWEQAQRILMNKANKVVLVTDEAKDDYISKYQVQPDKIIVVPNTIHPDVFLEYPIHPEILERFNGSFTLLYVGDTGLRRGTDVAIKAIEALKEKIPEIKLILVGKSSEDIMLKKMVDALKISEYVEFEGWQDVKLFPSYIQAADICLSPLKRNQHHDTTYANKIFQYMGLGKPLLVSDSTAQANVVINEKCGLVFKAEDVHDFIKAVELFYRNPDMKEAMGRAGFNAVKKKWNWKITSQSLIDFYQNQDFKLKASNFNKGD